jgi:hypothetical protein
VQVSEAISCYLGIASALTLFGLAMTCVWQK